MPRIRSIKPEFWADEKMARQLTREQRLFYIALWNEADDEGRFIANARKLLGAVFPYDEDVQEAFIENSLRALADTERLVLYEVEGCRYGQLTKFPHHQRINRPTPSKLPAPPLENPPLPESSLSPHAHIKEGSPPEQGTGSRERSREQGAGERAPAPEAVSDGDDLDTWLDAAGASLPDWPPLRDPLVRQTLLADFAQELRPGVWKRPDGGSLPEAERPRMLASALRGYAAEGNRTLITNEFVGLLRALIRGEQAATNGAPSGVSAAEEEAAERAKREAARARANSDAHLAEYQAGADAMAQATEAAKAWMASQDDEIRARATLLAKARLQAEGVREGKRPPAYLEDRVARDVATELGWPGAPTPKASPTSLKRARVNVGRIAGGAP